MTRRRGRLAQHPAKLGAVIYTRVSTDEQVSNTSLHSQAACCRQWCAENGLTVLRLFREEGKSGRTADRPELQAMLQYIRENRQKVGYLVVRDMTRLARKTSLHLRIRDELRDFGIRLHAVTQPVEDTAEGELLGIFQAALGEYENDKRGEKLLEGMQQRFYEDGGWISSPATGYQMTRKGNVPTLVLDPLVAPIMREVFELVASGKTVTEAAKYAEAAGLRGRNKGKPIEGKRLGQMLRNRMYCGELRVLSWGKEAVGSCVPLVSRDVFERAQQTLNRKGRSYGQYAAQGGPYPLKGFVTCASCTCPLRGSANKGRHGGRYPAYHCTKCKGMRIRKGTMEQMFMALLDDHAFSNADYLHLQDAVRTRFRERDARRTAQERQTRARLQDITDMRHRAVTLVLKGTLSDEDFQLRVQELENEKASLTASLDAMRTAAETDLSAVLELTRGALMQPGRFWAMLPHDQQRRFQTLIFPGQLQLQQDKTFGTPVAACVYNELRENFFEGVEVVDLTGIEPVTS